MDNLENLREGYSLQHLLEESRMDYPPPDDDDQRPYHLARQLWRSRAAAAAEADAAAANAANAEAAAANRGNNHHHHQHRHRVFDLSLVDPNLLPAAAVPPAAPAAPAPAPALAAAAPAAAPAAAAAPALAAPVVAAAANAGPGPAHPEPVASPRLLALVAAAEPGRRRAWDDEEDAYLRAARLAGWDFGRIGAALGRTAAACETRAKGKVYKGGRKPGQN